MNYQLDPELAPAMAALAAKAARAPRPTRGDWLAVREVVSAGQAYMATLTPVSSGVTTTRHITTTMDGEDEIELRWYTKTGAAPGSAVVYTHGGGILGGSLDLYDEVISWYVAQTGVPFLSVGLRLAPEAPTSTAMAEDSYSALTWLVNHASELGVDHHRIAVMATAAAVAQLPARPSWLVIEACTSPNRSSCTRCSMTATQHQAPFPKSC